MGLRAAVWRVRSRALQDVGGGRSLASVMSTAGFELHPLTPDSRPQPLNSENYL